MHWVHIRIWFVCCVYDGIFTNGLRSRFTSWSHSCCVLLPSPSLFVPFILCFLSKVKSWLLWTTSNSIKGLSTPHMPTHTVTQSHTDTHSSEEKNKKKPWRTHTNVPPSPLYTHTQRHTHKCTSITFTHTHTLSVLYTSPWCVYCSPPSPVSVWNTLRRPVACERWLGLGEEKHNYFSPRLFMQRWQKLVWSMKSQKFLPCRGRQIGINLRLCARVCLQSFHLCSFPIS